MKSLLIALMLLSSPALAGGAHIADPFAPPDIGEVLPVCNTSWQCNAAYSDTNAKTLVLGPIDTSLRTAVIIEDGQSLGENEGERPVVTAHGAHIFNYNYLDGGVYLSADPQLGTSINSTGPGYMGSIVADALISDGSVDQVILVPQNIGGTSVDLWATGGPLQNVPCIAIQRLALRGITPSTPNVIFLAIWNQGQSDRQGPGHPGTTQAQYMAWLTQVFSRMDSCGFVGRKFVDINTWSGNDTWPPVAAAQAAMANGTTIFVGGNLDSIGNNCRIDMTHLNSACGLPTGAALEVRAIHASGPLF